MPTLPSRPADEHLQRPSWWDRYSDQPYQLERRDKPRGSKDNVIEYAKVGATAIALAPAIGWRFATLRSQPPSADQFAGLSVSPDSKHNDQIVDLIEELNVRQLLLRIPVWNATRLEPYLGFMARFPDCEFTINIVQNRDSYKSLDSWHDAVQRIVEACPQNVTTFQICNAINRSKWGFRHSGDYLALQSAIQDIVDQHKAKRFLGSSIIDFEPLVTMRTLFNFHDFKIDGCASELYVNRRGSPDSRQFGLFGLREKIRLIAAMSSLSNRVSNASTQRIWITETNWPLLNTKPWTPNSGNPRSTVDEATQASYLERYFAIAWQTGLVERVFWWQLINPGYGLVDHRGGQLRTMASFDAFKRTVAGGFRL